MYVHTHSPSKFAVQVRCSFIHYDLSTLSLHVCTDELGSVIPCSHFLSQEFLHVGTLLISYCVYHFIHAHTGPPSHTHTHTQTLSHHSGMLVILAYNLSIYYVLMYTHSFAHIHIQVCCSSICSYGISTLSFTCVHTCHI